MIHTCFTYCNQKFVSVVHCSVCGVIHQSILKRPSTASKAADASDVALCAAENTVTERAVMVPIRMTPMMMEVTVSHLAQAVLALPPCRQI